MKVQLVKDERYPVYDAIIMDGTYPPWGLGIDWPEDLDMENYNWVCHLYREWQDTLAELYKKHETIPLCLSTQSWQK